jgi:DNA-directed RNA polymerase
MTTPYGSTKDGIEDQLWARIKTGETKLEADGKEITDGKEINAAVKYLAGIICEVRDNEMPSAMRIMRWLQDAARQSGGPLTWRTPTDSKVRQAIYMTKDSRPHIGKRKYHFRELTDQIDVKAQARAIAPNVIHAIDASLAYKTVNACVKAGIHHVQAIHDCFGTHATRAGELRDILRRQFVDVHSGGLLADLKEQLGATKPPPVLGTLDVSKVRYSEHAFS